jgi:hypothetical protein
MCLLLPKKRLCGIRLLPKKRVSGFLLHLPKKRVSGILLLVLLLPSRLSGMSLHPSRLSGMHLHHPSRLGRMMDGANQLRGPKHQRLHPCGMTMAGTVGPVAKPAREAKGVGSAPKRAR